MGIAGRGRINGCGLTVRHKRGSKLPNPATESEEKGKGTKGGWGRIG